MYIRSPTNIPASRRLAAHKRLLVGFSIAALTAVVGATGFAAAQSGPSPTSFPKTKADCVNWQSFGFKNHGQCVSWWEHHVAGHGYGGQG